MSHFNLIRVESSILLQVAKRSVGAVAALGLFLAIGCGGNVAKVTGTVSVDGQPLLGSDTVRVTVMFFPESSGALAAAKIDERGTYVLSTGSQEGLVPGNYSVTISAKEITATATSGSPSARDLVAPDYGNPKTSGLKAEVKPGSNTFDFDLKSDSKG